MFLVVLLMSFSTCDPFNKSVPVIHQRLLYAYLKVHCATLPHSWLKDDGCTM